MQRATAVVRTRTVPAFHAFLQASLSCSLIQAVCASPSLWKSPASRSPESLTRSCAGWARTQTPGLSLSSPMRTTSGECRGMLMVADDTTWRIHFSLIFPSLQFDLASLTVSKPPVSIPLQRRTRFRSIPACFCSRDSTSPAFIRRVVYLVFPPNSSLSFLQSNPAGVTGKQYPCSPCGGTNGPHTSCFLLLSGTPCIKNEMITCWLTLQT